MNILIEKLKEIKKESAKVRDEAVFDKLTTQLHNAARFGTPVCAIPFHSLHNGENREKIVEAADRTRLKWEIIEGEFGHLLTFDMNQPLLQ